MRARDRTAAGGRRRAVQPARGAVRRPGREPAPRLRGAVAAAAGRRLLHDRLGRPRVQRRARAAVARAPTRRCCTTAPAAFYAARAHLDGAVDPVRETLRSLTGSASDPISGGRHKVFGHAGLHIVPQTSTIASHLPRAVGLGFALGLAAAARAGRRRGRTTRSCICSFGDASVNHSTAAGALNAAAYLTHVRRDCPVLFVVRGQRPRHQHPYAAGLAGRGAAAGSRACPTSTRPATSPPALLDATEAALAAVRTRRSPGGAAPEHGPVHGPRRLGRRDRLPLARRRSRPTTPATRCSAPPAPWSRAATGAPTHVLGALRASSATRVHDAAREVVTERAARDPRAR